jgi:diadenosine tetraphosphate (Ap4A) HIT family hydrolase
MRSGWTRGILGCIEYTFSNLSYKNFDRPPAAPGNVVAPYQFPSSFPCFLCEYMSGRLPWYPLEEGAHACTFLNIRQRSRGALLVAPRRHVQALSMLTDEEVAEVMAYVQRAGAAVTRALQPDGLHVFCNVGRIAGQSEGHVHFQVIPRYDGVAYDFRASAVYEPATREQAQEITGLVRDCYARPVEAGASDG